MTNRRKELPFRRYSLAVILVLLVGFLVGVLLITVLTICVLLVIILLIGLVISLFIAFIRDYFDVKIKYDDDMTTINDIPVLAAIPDFEYFAKNLKAVQAQKD